MSTSAGYVDVGTDLAATLRRLAGLRPGVPVLSLYLDLDPRELPTQADHRTAIRSLLDEASKRVEEHETDHEGRMSLRADLERARSFLEGWSPKRTRGIAVFCASHAELFETFGLPRPMRTQVVINDSPFVSPLARGADTRDWLIVVVDAQHGRILHGNPEHVTDLGDLEDHVAGQHERQSTSDHQRWVEHQVDQHLERVVRQVDEHLRGGRFDRVIVGGPPEIALAPAVAAARRRTRPPGRPLRRAGPRRERRRPARRHPSLLRAARARPRARAAGPPRRGSRPRRARGRRAPSGCARCSSSSASRRCSSTTAATRRTRRSSSR